MDKREREFPLFVRWSSEANELWYEVIVAAFERGYNGNLTVCGSDEGPHFTYPFHPFEMKEDGMVRGLIWPGEGEPGEAFWQARYSHAAFADAIKAGAEYRCYPIGWDDDGMYVVGYEVF